MKVPNDNFFSGHTRLSLSRLQNEGSQLLPELLAACDKSIKATE